MLDTVITSTIAGSFVCLMLLLFKNRLLNLLGGKILYHISLFAMLIFVIPFNMISFQLPQFTNQPLHTETVIVGENTQTQQIDQTAQNTTVWEQEINEVRPAVTHNLPSMARSENPITLQEILIAIWLLGFVISISRYFISYWRFKRKICGFEECEGIDGVRLIKSPLIASPMIFGFFKPTLAIPEIEMQADEYELAIKHEMIHFKHHDSWLKLFAVIINSVCWFNPITYFMLNLIGETCEYACDEQVTKEMDTPGKQKYSEMILTMVCQSSPALSSNMAKNKKQLKRRFEMIMKRKKTNIIQTVVCSILMLTGLCSSVVFASEITPLVSSLLKDDYVYITSFDGNDYIDNVPIEKDGVYYLPLRQFLNNCEIDNDKIKYDNGKIAIDMWSQETTLISVPVTDARSFNVNDATDREKEVFPAKYIWSTICYIDGKDAEIDGKKYTLKNAPYLENGVTYVPYEYIKLLKNYEDSFYSKEINGSTNTFSCVMLYGYDSMTATYYTDNVQMQQREVGDLITVESAFDSRIAMVEIKKTGYRTEFKANTKFFNETVPANATEIEIVLNKVTKIFSNGSDLEGLFTVWADGKVIYEKEKGFITNLPVPAGEGITDMGETRLLIGDLKMTMWFFGFGNSAYTEHNLKSRKSSEIYNLADTQKIALYPTEVKLGGYTVTRADKYNYINYNTKNAYSDIRVQFDDYVEVGPKINVYYITQEQEYETHFIDENTFSSQYFLMKDSVRLDSFDAIVTLLPDNKFELKSTDGKYIVRGTTGVFVPMWEWPEEKREEWPPQVKMINE